MDSLISTFHIDWHLIVAQAINFVIVIAVLYFAALKPLKKLMEERGATIKGGLDNAKKQEELLKNAEMQYQEMIAKANADAVAKMKDAKKDAEAKGLAMMEKIQEEIANAKATGLKQIEAEKMKAMEEIRKEAVALVIAATEKVLGTAAEGKVETKLVEESIKNI